MAGGVCMVGACVVVGACMAGCVWQGACMAGRVHAGETVTEAGGTHPTLMHSCCDDDYSSGDYLDLLSVRDDMINLRLPYNLISIVL